MRRPAGFLTTALLLTYCIVTAARTPAPRTAHSTPQRFLIYSFRHSGTHFLRNALMRAPGVSIGDEVFMSPPPKIVKVNQSLLRAAWGKNSTAEHVPQSDSQLVQQVVTPTLDLYWGSVNMSAHANRSDAPVGGAAHYVCDARYRFDDANPCGANGTSADGKATWQVTWGELQSNLLRKRALGALWNHHNVVGDGDPPAGVFACAAFVRRLLELDVRVILYERQNGLAERLSNGNTKRADSKGSTRTVQVKKEQLESFNAEWEKRDATYRCALGALERAGIPAVFVSYERLMAQPGDLARLYSFIGVDAPADPAPDAGAAKWHTEPVHSYIRNADEVRAWMHDGQLPGWNECMLDGDCPSAAPLFTAGAP